MISDGTGNPTIHPDQAEINGNLLGVINKVKDDQLNLIQQVAQIEQSLRYTIEAVKILGQQVMGHTPPIDEDDNSRC